MKQIISKLAADHPSSWHKILPFALWCLRTSVNQTLGISPFQAAFGRIGIEPLQLLCDDWVGKRQLPLHIAKAPLEYLQELERKLLLASEYAAEHATREQARYTHAYNLRSREKSFEVGERVIYLMPSSTHKLTRTWQGPCVVVRKNSPYSYIIEYNGKKQWSHANHLRKYNERLWKSSIIIARLFLIVIMTSVLYQQFNLLIKQCVNRILTLKPVILVRVMSLITASRCRHHFGT